MCARAAESDEVEELLTQRLVLVRPRPGHATALARLADNPKIAPQTARMPYPYRLGDAEAWIARAAERAGGGREVNFVIVTRETGEAIGAAGFGVLDQEPEIGYWLGEAHWGQGYATEAIQRVVDHAFLDCGLPRLGGRARVGNLRSRRVLEKCGFQYRGQGMLYPSTRRGPVPTEDFMLERFVWESLKRWRASITG